MGSSLFCSDRGTAITGCIAHGRWGRRAFIVFLPQFSHPEKQYNMWMDGWMDGTLCTASVASPETTRATLLVHYSTVGHDRAKQSLCWRFVNLLEMRSTLMDVENVERRNQGMNLVWGTERCHSAVTLILRLRSSSADSFN